MFFITIFKKSKYPLVKIDVIFFVPYLSHICMITEYITSFYFFISEDFGKKQHDLVGNLVLKKIDKNMKLKMEIRILNKFS